MASGGDVKLFSTEEASTSGRTFTSDFLLRQSDGSSGGDSPGSESNTIAIVLNWVLPQCTPRLLSSGVSQSSAQH